MLSRGWYGVVVVVWSKREEQEGKERKSSVHF